jgi:hypothetical protein
MSFEIGGQLNGVFIQMTTVRSKVIVDSCLLLQTQNTSIPISLFLLGNGTLLIKNSAFQSFLFDSSVNGAIFGLIFILLFICLCSHFQYVCIWNS